MKEVVIQANRSEKHYWKEIWEYRDLLGILARRDVMVRYKQTIIGAAWGFVRPLFTLIGFSFIFTKLSGQNQNYAVPFPIIAFSGILIWAYFSNCFTQISNSLVINTNMIGKVYFPRIIMPISATFVVLVDFLMAFLLFLALFWWYGIWPDLKIFMIPLLLIHALMLAMGLGLIFAVGNVKYRDFGQLAPFLIQFGMFICPVAYTHESVTLTPMMAKIYNLNPVVGLIDAFRWVSLPLQNDFPWQSFIPSILITIILLFISVTYFRKREDSFVDYI